MCIYKCVCVCLCVYTHDSKIDLTVKGLRIANNISIRKKKKKNIEDLILPNSIFTKNLH